MKWHRRIYGGVFLFIIGCGLVMILLSWITLSVDRNPYIPGRDTVMYWNSGKCELNRSASGFCLTVDGIDRYSNIEAYARKGDLLFLKKEGKIIVFDCQNMGIAEYTDEEIEKLRLGLDFISVQNS